MKRAYFIRYYRDFGNTFELEYAESKKEIDEMLSDGWERITLKKAQSLIYGYKGDMYAADEIFPHNLPKYRHPYDLGYTLKNHIWVK